MKIDYETALITEFECFDYRRFLVNFSKKHIFVCGGLVDITKEPAPSFRDLFLRYCASVSENEIIDSIILAESFKDYFKESTYSDLLVFEDEIANIATVVLIFLESPGSLVELGMFCGKPHHYKKLLVVAPKEHTGSEDSFIYLGPLEHIRRKENTSVTIYPWPSNTVNNYDVEYLFDLKCLLLDKLRSSSKQISFQAENSGHVAFLIYEIIRLSYPILIGDIELALSALQLDLSEGEIKRHIYLLTKTNMIDCNLYSTYKYYYPLYPSLKTINFGKTKDNKVKDSASIQMNINQSYILDDSDSAARKRRTAKKEINKKLSGEQQ
ncbi:MAG: retron St85 family effector protein [Aeromonadaceae bacterium]